MYFEFILIFIVTLFFIYVVKHYASKIGFIDIPNERSMHGNTIPHGAGIGFYMSVFLVLSFYHFDMLISYIWIVIAIFFIFVTGILDDHHDISPNTKFLIIFISTIFLSFNNIIITNLGTFFNYEISLGWVALPFTIFAVAGFTNALNLIDGLDGLAATVSIVILTTFFIVGYQNDDFFIMLISGAFISSLFAFIFFNWYPASIFMGDSGSLTIGFVISMLAIKSLEYLSATSILFIAAIPILDTLVVMFRRKSNGRSIFAADMCHIHHVLKSLFDENTKKTVLFLGLIQFIYSMVGLFLNKNIKDEYIFILFLFNVIFLYLILDNIIKKQKRKC